MSFAATIKVNGVEYDAITGLQVATLSQSTSQVDQPKARPTIHAHGVHSKQQRSTTLNRQFVAKKTQGTRPPTGPKSLDMRRPKHARSPHITKFSPSHTTSTAIPTSVKKEAVSPLHPAVARANKRTATPVKPVHVPAKQQKQSEIEAALARSHPSVHPKKKRAHRRALNVASASVAVLLLAGYFTYMNMPGLSVRIAAAQAGIEASYPEYRPIGYSLSGPIAYRDGEVTMNFASNSGPQQFALSQSESSWDSTALLENHVNPQSDGRYATYNDAGLTAYTYGNNAAWVNGGILYTVEGTAALSNEQVRRIATSL